MLDIGLQVGHLKVIIDPVDHKVGEPGCLSGRLEQLIEQLKALLAEMISEDLEAHERGVVEETLSEEGEAEILNVVICNVQMHE